MELDYYKAVHAGLLFNCWCHDLVDQIGDSVAVSPHRAPDDWVVVPAHRGGVELRRRQRPR